MREYKFLCVRKIHGFSLLTVQKKKKTIRRYYIYRILADLDNGVIDACKKKKKKCISTLQTFFYFINKTFSNWYGTKTDKKRGIGAIPFPLVVEKNSK